MRYLAIELCRPGMKLSSDVMDSYGRILMSTDAILTEQYITKLSEMGVHGLYIDDELSKGIEIKPPISPVLRAEGLQAVRNKDIDACLAVAKKIVAEVLSNGFHSLDMADLRTFDDYTYAHSVNVAVLSCATGLGLSLSDEELEDLIFACLLHDLGKISIPEKILNKPGRLTPEEFALVKTHPKASYDYIYDRLDISSHVKSAVLSHHENYDGTGYPNGLKGQEIPFLANIIHVADVYDALTSQRPYKLPYAPVAAVELLSHGRNTQFAPDVLDCFLKYVPVYPKGYTITLSNGDRGIVVENSTDHSLRPLVRLEKGGEVDLIDYPELTILSPAAQDYDLLVNEENARKEMISQHERLRIMVVDRLGDTFNNISGKLSYLHDFQWVKSAGVAEGVCEKYDYPDLIILDIDHEDILNSYELRTQYDRLAQGVPIIVLGSFKDASTILGLRNIGITNYTLKPYLTTYLQDNIRKTVDAYRAAKK